MIPRQWLLLPLLALAYYPQAGDVLASPVVLLAAAPGQAVLTQPAGSGPASMLAAPLPPTDSLGPALEAKLDELNRRVTLLADQLRSQGLLNMHNQLEGLRQEVAKLRGAQEELAYAQQVADKRQKDLFADFDSRIKDMSKEVAKRAATPEPVRPQATSTPTSVTQPPPVPIPVAAAVEAENETKAYETALNHFKSADYVAAVSAFNAFVVNHPQSNLASNALYWLGLSYYALTDFKSSVEAQKRLLRDYPQSHKVPDANLSLARALMQVGENDTARQTLEQLVSKYPTARAADTARRMLTLFK